MASKVPVTIRQLSVAFGTQSIGLGSWHTGQGFQLDENVISNPFWIQYAILGT